jgi:phospholipid/cholesterol/gamma-HCH transport system permease protein
MHLQTQQRGGKRIITLEGELVRGAVAEVDESVRQALAGGDDVLLDVHDVRRFDATGAELLLRHLRAGEGRLQLLRARPEMRAYLEALPPPQVFRGEVTRSLPVDVPNLLLTTATQVVERLTDAVKLFLSLFLQFVFFVTIGPFRGHKLRLGRVAQEINRAGIDAIPIVALVGVLMGLILGFQSAAQLQKIAGESLNLFSANLVGVSITRELGPIMTAILIAGRSGSAIAAEVGTMVVTDELDAMRVMGLNPVPFLMVPKVLALAIAVPCLVVIADLVGIGGGFVTGVAVLGIPFSEYWNQTQAALQVSDLLTGLFKACVFGVLIGLTGMVNGLQVRGGSAIVGLKTTSAVVTSIALVIFADLVFTMAFFLGDV